MPDSPSHCSGRKAVLLSVAAALLLLIGGGFTYRVLEASLARQVLGVQFPKETLTGLPMRLDDWLGKDVSLKTAGMEVADADEYVCRSYTRLDNQQQVNMYVACGIPFQGLMPRRPEMCYRDAGWVLLEKERVSLPPLTGVPLDCWMMRFRRGGPSSPAINVLNYYIIDGRCWPDLGVFRRQGSGTGKPLRYIVQVQITCGDTALSMIARQPSTEFAAEMTPIVLKLLEDAAVGSSSDG